MTFRIHPSCEIHPSASINVNYGSIGPRSIIREGVIIEGNSVKLGTECYLDIRARIGGGSCFHTDSTLQAGDWLHMGVDSHINTAERVWLGQEVGIGVGTKIFTHGAYLSAWEGFPVQWGQVTIGNHVWLPHAWVNPGVDIDDNVVVAAMSLVNQNLRGNSLYAGIPAKRIRELLPFDRIDERDSYVFLKHVMDKVKRLGFGDRKVKTKGIDVLELNDETLFILNARMIVGPADAFTEAFREQLRRNGVRFKYCVKDGEYVPWEKMYS